MHAGKSISHLDDLCFQAGEFMEPLFNLVVTGEIPGKSHLGRMVSRHGFEQALGKVGQFRILDMPAEQVKSLAAPGLD